MLIKAFKNISDENTPPEVNIFLNFLNTQIKRLNDLLSNFNKVMQKTTGVLKQRGLQLKIPYLYKMQ
jgi:hypothetical protein